MLTPVVGAKAGGGAPSIARGRYGLVDRFETNAGCGWAPERAVDAVVAHDVHRQPPATSGVMADTLEATVRCRT